MAGQPIDRVLSGILLLGVCACGDIGDRDQVDSISAYAITGPPGTAQTKPIAARTFWSYYDGGVDQGTDWRSYRSRTWPNAEAPFGYGESDIVTPVSFGPDPEHKHPTTYFRRIFSVGNDVQALFLRVMYDDGFVFYINGEEGGRANLPPGPITFSTLASGHEAEGQYVMFDISSQIPNLRPFELNTLAFEVHQQRPSSSDLVFDAELIAWTSAPAHTTTDGGIPRRSTWRIWDRAGAPDSAWRSSAYDDTGWSAGPGPLGFGEPYVETFIGAGPITTYFRETMIIDDPAVITGLFGEVMFDDGFVVYLNGHEIGRAGMPAGAPEPSTLASGHEAAGRYEPFDWTAAIPFLVEGENIVAVEVHQARSGSSDLVFDLGLSVRTTSPASDIAPGSTWRYWDRGGDLGAEWPSPRQDDSTWASGAGPLGYGEPYVVTPVFPSGDPNHKRITTYFRRTFDVADPASVRSLLGSVMYDDGFVAYLNGVEIGRAAMPRGPVIASTLAFDHEAEQIYRGFDWSHAIPLLVPGSNTLAVELHQDRPSSSDLVFDLSLRVEAQAWYVQHSGTNLPLRGVWFLDASRGWVVGAQGTLLRTTDGGETWTPEPSGTSAMLWAIQFIDDRHGWIVGDQGAVLATSDGGETWTLRSADVNTSFVGVDFVDPTTGWVAANVGSNVYHTRDGGLTWAAQPIGTSGLFFDIDFVDAQRGWLVGSIPVAGDSWAAIYDTTDGGATWTQRWISGRHFTYLFDLEVLDASTVWSAGQSSLSGVGEIKWVTRDAGATWAEAPETANGVGIFAVDFVDAMTGWGAGFSGSIIRTDDAGATWTVQQKPINNLRPSLYDLYFLDAHRGWAVGDGGAILKTTTGGR